MTEKAWMKFRIAFAVVGILVGISVLCVFGVLKHNWNAALWGIISGLVASITLYVHVQQVRRKWEENIRVLRIWMLCGCFVQLAGVVGFAVYLALAISQNQDLVIQGEGYYITLVWCFMTWKWGFALFFYSRKYRLKTEVAYSLQT